MIKDIQSKCPSCKLYDTEQCVHGDCCKCITEKWDNPNCSGIISCRRSTRSMIVGCTYHTPLEWDS